MSRFFVAPECVGADSIVIDSRDDIHHMTKVLRLSEGDKIDVSDSVRWEYLCEIKEINSTAVVLRILDKQGFSTEPDIKVTLFQGIPKGSKFETIVQKTVELGIDAIQPVFMARTVVVDKGNYSKKVTRLNKIAAEAVKQCKRGVIPQVEDAIRFKEMLALLNDYDMVLFPYENEKCTTIKDVLRNCQDVRNIAVIIGPEGGFSDDEAEQVVSAGGLSVSLGKTTLRTETAGMAALAMIMYELEM